MKIRKLSKQDYRKWLILYEVYAEHYKVKLSNEGILSTWSWLMDDAHPAQGLVADLDGALVGLAQFRSMPSPLRGHNIGFVDDIIVLPQNRGNGIAEALFREIKSYGNKLGWVTIRFITRNDNYRAKKVYDRVAIKSTWEVYEMDCT